MTQIAFGLMSAGYREDTISQLVHALHPMTVIAHHDLHRFPALRLDAPNTYFVPDPCRTGWGTWGLVEGGLRLIEHALDTFEFDVLVMISPTCLPIRPLDELVEYLDGHPADAYIDLVMLDEDPEALAEFAYRVFFPAGSVGQRLMLKARNFAISGGHERIDRQGLSIARPLRRDWRWHVGQALARMALNGRLSRHPFGPRLRPAMSSGWFAATRPVLEKIVAFGRDPEVLAHYSRCRLIDENFFATAIASLDCHTAPMLHYVNDFDEHGHPTTLDTSGLDTARASGKFLARKFADDPTDVARLSALAAAGCSAAASASLRECFERGASDRTEVAREERLRTRGDALEHGPDVAVVVGDVAHEEVPRRLVRDHAAAHDVADERDRTHLDHQ